MAASSEDDQWIGWGGEWFLDQGWRDPLCISQEGGWSGACEPVYWVKMIQSGVRNEMNILGRKLTIAQIVEEIKQNKI